MKKYKLLAICFMTISIILAGVILVQTWLTTPIRFEGATEDIYILRSDKFTCFTSNIPEGKYGNRTGYNVYTDMVSLTKREKMYNLFKTFKPTEITEREVFGKSAFIELSFGSETSAIGMHTYNDGYICVYREWRLSEYSGWMTGKQYYYKANKTLLVDLINDFIAVAEKQKPELY